MQVKILWLVKIWKVYRDTQMSFRNSFLVNYIKVIQKTNNQL